MLRDPDYITREFSVSLRTNELMISYLLSACYRSFSVPDHVGSPYLNQAFIYRHRPILHRLVDESCLAMMSPPSLAVQPSSPFHSVPSIQASVPSHFVLPAHANHPVAPHVKGGPV